MPILGAVLVGGASRRFGSNKADAQLDGVSLLDHQLSILRGVPVDCLAYVGGERRPALDPLAHHVDDAIVGVDTTERSSLLGILAALTYAGDKKCESVIILGCDVPLVTTQTLQQLVAALSGGAAERDSISAFDIAVASSDAEHAHWSIMAANVSALATLRAAYENGERAVHRAAATVRVARLGIGEDEAVNINDQITLVDIAAALRGAR
ncbi:MAG: NTP transferase domain-containing protein [Actinomycetota bacterium]|nr:NTP transferase domain-containing protein [Actinomycetota bacterium]